ncbi:MAG: hypothetical protein Q9M94_02765 [Candidatus Gracilibacteria bacterium]|nr:hypothetical protein [Candidatus Gracilibacteria bacterium]
MVREALPKFSGQYSDEKVLFRIQENKVNFIFTKLYILISFLIFSSILSAILYYFVNYITAIVIFIFLLISIFGYYYYIFKDSFLIFTTRRIIKQIRTGIFSKHKKELKIMDIKSSLSNKRGFIQTLLRIGNIKVEGSESEGSIYFTGIKEYSQVSNYIGRVIDHIKLKGHTDDIARYQDKKYRKESKKI